MKKTFLLPFFLLFSVAQKAQTLNYKIIGNDLESMHKLHIRPYVSFFIPPTIIGETYLPVNINVDAHYWFPKLLDVRAGLNIGSFKGFTAGATFHIIDGIKQKKSKYVLSRTTSGRTETTKYFKASSNTHVIFGPCVDVMAGSLKDAGFYTKIDFGFDYQKFARSYAEVGSRVIPSSSNGWFSLKVQAVIASMNHDDNRFDDIPFERRIAIGGQLNPQVAARPWKNVCVYAGLPLGVMKILKAAKGDDIQPILYINLGVSVNIL